MGVLATVLSSGLDAGCQSSSTSYTIYELRMLTDPSQDDQHELIFKQREYKSGVQRAA